MVSAVLCDVSRCTGCEACKAICPESCIDMAENSEGFLHPEIDHDRCSKCKKCERVCPVLKRPVLHRANEPQVLACWHKDPEIRDLSSSGGAFSALAEMIINEKGVVFGAAYGDRLHVHHTYVETLAELDRLRRSKYVQSQIGDVFKKVKDFLQAERKVLFVGTPCQVAGLHAFLGGDHPNLLTVDFICHGVPSPKVFRKYLDEIEKTSGDILVDLNFRDKRRGWLNNSVVGTTATDKEIVIKGVKNSFYNAFIVGIFLRNSCYQCPVNGLPRFGNLTIADFWGISPDGEISQKEIDKGISLLMINDSGLEKSFFSRLADRLLMINEDLSTAQEGNVSMCKASHLPSNRSAFFNDFDKQPYAILEKNYLRPSLKRRLDQMIKENFSTSFISKVRNLQKLLRR